MHATIYRRPILLLALAAAGLAGCSLLVGCAALRSGETQLRPVSGKARSYDSVALSYRLSSPVRSRGEIQTVGYSQPAARSDAVSVDRVPASRRSPGQSAVRGDRRPRRGCRHREKIGCLAEPGAPRHGRSTAGPDVCRGHRIGLGT